MTDHLDLIAVNLIFDQLNATSAVVGENTKRLSFHEFLGALGSLALAMYDEIAPDQLAGFRVHGFAFMGLRSWGRFFFVSPHSRLSFRALDCSKRESTSPCKVRAARGWLIFFLTAQAVGVCVTPRDETVGVHRGRVKAAASLRRG